MAVFGRSENEWSRLIRLIVASGVVLGVVIASVVAVSAFNMNGEPSIPLAQMEAVSPPGVLSPEEVPAALEGHYLAAQTHFETFEQIPCFCGCEQMLGHRHLGDCFIRPDGSGLEAHALGCGVCLGEAAQVEDLINSGVTDPDEIRAAVIATWGDPYS